MMLSVSVASQTTCVSGTAHDILAKTNSTSSFDHHDNNRATIDHCLATNSIQMKSQQDVLHVASKKNQKQATLAVEKQAELSGSSSCVNDIDIGLVTHERQIHTSTILKQQPSHRKRKSKRTLTQQITSNHSKDSSKNDSVKPTTASRKSVSFRKLDLEGPTILPIEHVTSLPKREIKQRWITVREFRSIQYMAAAHIEFQTPESSDFSARGLERLTGLGMLQFLEARKGGLCAVLQQQYLCPKHIKKKDELIAAAYQEKTKEYRKKAAEKAVLDAKEIQEYLAQGCDADSVRIEQTKRLAKNGRTLRAKGLKRILFTFYSHS